jgi:hypothetical protein
MIHTGKKRILFSGIVKMFIIALLLCGLFGIVYLRSSVMRLEYSIGALENTKMNQLRERKMLLAEKTSLLSFEKIEASLSGSQGFVMPDRIRVIHVKKHEEVSPYRTALEMKHMREN